METSIEYVLMQLGTLYVENSLLKDELNRRVTPQATPDGNWGEDEPPEEHED